MDFEPPGTEDTRLEAAAAGEGQAGPSPQGERSEVGHSLRQGQDESSPHGQRREDVAERKGVVGHKGVAGRDGVL